jgi:hypothetical protein
VLKYVNENLRRENVLNKKTGKRRLRDDDDDNDYGDDDDDNNNNNNNNEGVVVDFYISKIMVKSSIFPYLNIQMHYLTHIYWKAVPCW